MKKTKVLPTSGRGLSLEEHGPQQETCPGEKCAVGQTEDPCPLRRISGILANGADQAGLCLRSPAWLNS